MIRAMYGDLASAAVRTLFAVGRAVYYGIASRVLWTVAMVGSTAILAFSVALVWAVGLVRAGRQSELMRYYAAMLIGHGNDLARAADTIEGGGS